MEVKSRNLMEEYVMFSAHIILFFKSVYKGTFLSEMEINLAQINVPNI